MNTASIIILVVFALLNITGIVLYMINNKEIKFTKEWWLNICWMVFCGLLYIPKGIIKLCKK